MAKPGRRVAGWVAAALLVAAVAVVARMEGASWPRIAWGALGFFVCALASSIVQWLVTGGPLRLERRPPPASDRPE